MSARDLAMPVWPKGDPVRDVQATQTPAISTQAVWTPAPGATTACIRVDLVRWSYSAVPTAPTLTLTWANPSGNTQTMTYYLGAVAGQNWMPFSRLFPPGITPTFTLSSVSGGFCTLDGDSEVSN